MRSRPHRMILGLLAAAMLGGALAPTTAQAVDANCIKPFHLWSRVNNGPDATPSIDVTSKYCFASHQADQQGQHVAAPADMRIAEPGTQVAALFGRYFDKPTWPITIKFVGTGLTLNRTVTATESCFIECSGYITPWVDVVVPADAVGYFEMSVRHPPPDPTQPTKLGKLERGCFHTLRGTCPF